MKGSKAYYYRRMISVSDRLDRILDIKMFYVPHMDDVENAKLIEGGPTTTQPRRAYQSGSRPPVSSIGRPRYVAVSSLTRQVVDANIRQPDPDRLVLSAGMNKNGCVRYIYYDEIPKWYRRVRVMAVVFSILATPLSLLCIIPALEYMEKVSF